MLGIKVRNQFLDLFPDTAIEIELNHPIGIITNSLDEIQGGLSFPIEIPVDGINASIIGRVDRLDIDEVFIDSEYCELWADGILLFPGKVTIQGSTNKRAKLFMIFNEIKDLSDVALASLDLGGDRSIGADTATRLAHARDTAVNPLDYDYIFFPVLNPKYLGDLYPVYLQNFQNYWSFVTDGFTENIAGVATPFIRVDYLLTKIFKALGYTLDNQWQTNDELKQLVLYNNYSIYEDLNTWASSINLTNHVPYTQAIDFLKAIVGTFALGLFPDPHNKTCTIIPFRDLILSPEADDWTSRAAADFGYETNRDFISKFRYDIDTNDDLSVTYSGITAPPGLVVGEGLTARIMRAASEFGIRYAIADNSIYFITPPGLTLPYVIQYQNPVIKDGSDKEYTSTLIPMWNSWNLHKDGVIELGDDLVFQEWMLPHIKHLGYTTYIQALKTTCVSFRTMIYRGFQPCDDGISGTYPMASATEYNIRGEQIGNYSLEWDRENGVYNKFWKLPYEMLRSKKKVTRKLLLTIRDLLNFKFQNKYRIENQNYFMTKLRFNITARGLSPVDAEMISTL